MSDTGHERLAVVSDALRERYGIDVGTERSGVGHAHVVVVGG